MASRASVMSRDGALMSSEISRISALNTAAAAAPSAIALCAACGSGALASAASDVAAQDNRRAGQRPPDRGRQRTAVRRARPRA